ncbi:MAG: hypothetical protein ACYC63_15960 [Armatimonadota bacterium]
MDHKPDPGRRKFLKDLSRWAVALGLGGGVAAIVERDPEKCLNRGICSGCGVFEECHLPQALSAKESLGKG